MKHFILSFVLFFGFAFNSFCQPPCTIIVKNYLDCDPQIELRFYQHQWGVPVLIETVNLPILPGSYQLPYIDTFNVNNQTICNNCDPTVYERKIFRNDTDRTDSIICCYKCYAGIS